MLKFLTVLPKDPIGLRRYQLQNDSDNLKFDIVSKLKLMKKDEKEAMSIEKASQAAQEVRRRSADMRKQLLLLSPKDQLDDEIFEVVVTHLDVPRESSKTWSLRPPYWRDIISHWNEFGYLSAVREYEDELSKLLGASKKATMNRWKREFKNKTVIKSNVDKTPKYGALVEQNLKADISLRIDKGLQIDNTVLRNLLLVKLSDTDQLGLLRENGGSHVFGDSWAKRFWKRNGFSNRAVTSKMRELPTDFEEKKENYIRIAAKLIHDYNVPADLVLGIDETNALFVPQQDRTVAKKGAKRVRLIGKGSDKAQITVTLGVTEAGCILPVQYIFGGTTTRCHPKCAPPPGSFVTHSKSHWQTEETFIEYLNVIIVPYIKSTILKLRLPPTQNSILKCDLHYSHKTIAVLELLAQNRIKVLYVPARCTDEFQECDTVINKPFKAGLRAGFRDFMHESFNSHQGDPALWSIKLTMGILKEKIFSFVETGMNVIRREAYKDVIINAFKSHGRFDEIRGSERQLI